MTKMYSIVITLAVTRNAGLFTGGHIYYDFFEN